MIPAGKRIRMLFGLLHVAAVCGLLALFCFWQNNSLVLSRHTCASQKIPAAFDGFTIVQLSDLHNKNFGDSQAPLIRKVKDAAPDMIVITGDLIDRRRYDPDTALETVKKLTHLAPVYYVSGNHEAWSGSYKDLRDRLREAGAAILDNTGISFTIGRESIEILGVMDPDFHTSTYREGTDTRELEAFLSGETPHDTFTVLLSHRPELMELYQKYQIDLVFSGHAHGGQIRLPFLGGLAAPDQGLFPRYDAGKYEEGSTTMLVSRGLGNSAFPLRLFNRPELVTVTLKHLP